MINARIWVELSFFFIYHCGSWWCLLLYRHLACSWHNQSMDCTCSDSIPTYRTSLHQFALYWKTLFAYSANTLAQTVWKWLTSNALVIFLPNGPMAWQFCCICHNIQASSLFCKGKQTGFQTRWIEKEIWQILPIYSIHIFLFTSYSIFITILFISCRVREDLVLCWPCVLHNYYQPM